MKLKNLLTMFLCTMLTCLGTISYAQTTVSGTVMDTDLNEPLIGANVVIAGTTDGASTEFDGTFSITSSQPLPWSLEVTYAGYGDQTITVDAPTTGLVINMTTEALIGQEVVISASRRREKVQNAPASVSVLTPRKLEGSPQQNATRNLVSVPGVQIQQQSAARINIEMRAGSGLFGTAVFPIKDYRSLVGPGLGTFSSDVSGLSNIDLARIEVVRGAGSALYGPGVTSGVVHFITKNPIDYPGTTVQVYGGEGNTLGGALRHAGTSESKKFGYKINAVYNSGDEFTLDGSEGTFSNSNVFTRQFDKFSETIVLPGVTGGVIDPTQPSQTLLNLERRADGNVMQEDFWNFGGDVTLEFRPKDDLSVFVTAGVNAGSSVFYNDLGEGLAQQTEIWGQARMQKGGLFAQVFYVDNNGGTEKNPTFLYQSGNDAGIARQQLEGQVQYNFDTPTFLNANWTAGVDYRLGTSDTRNLVYGRNEDDDNYSILGAYVQTKLELAPKFDLTLAGRFDKFNFFDETTFSPRAALVYKASPKSTFRFSYNHATFAPGGLVWNIDFPVNVPIPGALDFWLAGQRDIHDFSGATNIEFINHNVSAALISGATGIDIGVLQGLAAVLPQELPASLLGTGGLSNDFVHTVASGSLLGAMQANGLTAFIPLVQGILGTGAPTGNNGVFIGVNAFEAPDSPGFINNSLTNTIKGVTGNSKTWEIGYKGLIGDKLGASLDIYRITSRGGADFTAIAPLIGIQGFDQTGFEAKAAEIITALATNGVPLASATAIVAGAYGGTAALIPNFYGNGTVESSAVPQGDGVTHVAAGYRIFDAPYTRYGADLGLEYYINENLSLFGNYSWLNDNEFTRNQGDGSADFTTFINAPTDKFRIGFNYSQPVGFRANMSFQHDDSFFASVGQFSGRVLEKNLIDAGIGYKWDNGLALDLTAQNLLDSEYRAFANMPLIGRRVIMKATYSFGQGAE